MMPVQETEEVGFKRIGSSASDYDASLPIKKRRFPVVQFPPSPSEDISSFHPDGNLLKTERPSQPKNVSSFNPDENLIETEQPSLSVIIVSSSSAVKSYGLSNKNQDCVSNENKGESDNDSCYVDMVQNDIGMPGVKFQEPGFGGHACFSGYVEYEDKSLVTEKHTIHASPEICGGLKLSSIGLDSDPLASNKEEEIDVKMPEEKCSSPICQVEGGAGVSVGLKGHRDVELVSEKSDLSFLKQNSLEPVVLDLSLNKQGSHARCVEGNVGSDCDGSLLHSSREKWDLNTLMDSWEGCTSDAPVVQMSATRTNTAIETCSSEMVGSDSPCGKQTLLDSEHKGNSVNALIPSKKHLHLGVNSSSPKPMLEEDPYIYEYESDGNWDIAEVVDDDENNIEEDYEDGEVREWMQETEVEPDHECFTLGPLEQETKPENLDLRSEDDVHTTTRSTSCEQENESLCVKELHAVENTIGEDVNRPVKAAGRSQLSQYVKKDKLEGQVTADEIVDRIEELIPASSHGEIDNAIAVDVEQNRDLTLPTVKESVNSDNAKDINGSSRNSRMFNLNRASTDSTPCKAKKFSVDRLQDQSPWMNFSRRRGRSTNRLDSRSGEWDFGPNFSPETYSDQQIDYHVPDLDHNQYKLIPDGRFGGANRRGRLLLEDEGPFFFHGSSRRKSPGRRHGPSVRGGKMVARMPRDYSPTRCSDEDGSFDQQHGEKFTRNFADDTGDPPIYPRPQPAYEVDRPFFQERRNFSFQRKTFPRIDSKSPERSQARSPSQWLSLKRSDTFCGRPDMTRRRSPNYRLDRMRSPNERPIRVYITGQRRHGPAPDHGHMRSKTERLPLRNTSYDAIDPQVRIESDELFDGHVRSGQLNGEPDDDERLHSLKHHPFDDADDERLDCCRPFRFCAENDSRISWKRR